jgi:DNA repair protein RAD7
LTADSRRSAAEAQAQQRRATQEDGDDDDEDDDDYEDGANDDDDEEEGDDEEDVVTTTTRRNIREARITRASKTELAKLKAKEERNMRRSSATKKSNATKKNNKRKRPGDDDSDDSDDDDDDDGPNGGGGDDAKPKAKPRPGQRCNCASCNKLFTVTPYSRDAPDGGGSGLLCSECGLALSKGPEELRELAAKRKKRSRQTGGVGARRTLQSRILDGTFALGAKPLTTICVETLTRNVDLAEDLGDLPDHQIDRIARLVSKRRLLNPRTLQLFVRPDTEQLCVYDAAYLGTDDLTTSFAVMRNLRRLKIRNAVQFKDEALDYLLTRAGAAKLESVYIHGANLLSDAAWTRFLEAQGTLLRELRIYFTDKHVGNDLVRTIVANCPSLACLKIYYNQQLSNEGIAEIAKLKSLRKLGLMTQKHARPDTLAEVVEALGPTLETLSLREIPGANDFLLAAIHSSCRVLQKLQLTECENMTDKAFVKLFADWENPPLRVVNLERCRRVTADDAFYADDSEVAVGLCSDGFRALMVHSGKKLEALNIHACRHISTSAFDDVFGQPESHFPRLRDIEISFCDVTPDTVRSIFRSCPALRKLNVFGCMKVRDRGLKVPPTVNMVGGADAYGLRFDQ